MTSPVDRSSGRSPEKGTPRAEDVFKDIRMSLRPLSQGKANTPGSSAPSDISHKPSLSHSRGQSLDVRPSYDSTASSPTRPPSSVRPTSLLASRGDPARPATASVASSHDSHSHMLSHTPMLPPDLESLGKSSTGHLRTLSKFAESASHDQFAITSPTQEVAGLHGRKRLQRTDREGSSRSTVALTSGSGYGFEGRNWMDKQRQFLQAYEYLCHIGEAKEWIEDIIHKPIPAIVALEEALRNGVTLAEVVEALQPDRKFRIFRNPRLQYRHSDNIAIFFRFLNEIELPELFRFELIDLYEKKNIPKVIYCIHALSWLLFRQGIVDFRIGNLVGKLEFEHHELEEMQKGLDKAGVSMPSFGSMGADFGVEPEPEPVETEDERIDRELHEHEEMLVDLQSQARGALLRMVLAEKHQVLWEEEDWIIDLQSRIRGDFARQIFEYKLNMKRFAVNLQSACRGSLVRQRQKKTGDLWKSSEADILKLQSLIRASNVRKEVADTRLSLRKERHSVDDAQAAMRGFLTRKRVEKSSSELKKDAGPAVELQAALRGFLTRQRVAEQLDDIQQEAGSVRDIQAAIRASLTRKRVEIQLFELEKHSGAARDLQAAMRGLVARKKVAKERRSTMQMDGPIRGMQTFIRGMLLRKRIADDNELLYAEEEVIATIQANVRGMLARQVVSGQLEAMEASTESVEALQVASRAYVLRRDIAAIKKELKSHLESITCLQAMIRAAALRDQITATLAALEEEEPEVVELQASIHGMLLRTSVANDYEALENESDKLTQLQSLARGNLFRQAHNRMLNELTLHSEETVQLQALARAMLQRNVVGNLLAELDAEELAIIAIQAAARASMVRKEFAESQKFFKQNMEKVIKIQSFVRGRLQGEAYKSLTTGKNPPVNTVKNFVHLLNDSDFDFNEEVEFERMRKTVVQQVRQNEMAEQYIEQLDIKIALLVKNKITLDDVMQHQRNFGHAGSMFTNSNISNSQFDLKALNKNSRKKLDSYQQLFFTLQTQSQYLARLFKRIREQGLAEQESKKIETLMMGLFGYAQKRREEYYLLKLIARSVKEEVDGSATIQDYLRGNFFWSKLMTNYTRSPRDRKFLRELLGPLVRENIIEDQQLDLESDPSQIYRSAINNEELSTGRPSCRPLDVSREVAIKDNETRELFIIHLQDLREIADQVLLALEEQLPRMPYGIRYIAQQLFESLVEKFPRMKQAAILQNVGQWVFRFYLQPALTAPQEFGVVEKQLSPLQKRNLGEVAKVLSQVVTGKLFSGEAIFLQPLNAYVGVAIERMGIIFSKLIDVIDAEHTFDIDEFNDLYSKTKPTLYIKTIDIFAIHNLVHSELAVLCPGRDDMLREIVSELGSARTNESEWSGQKNAEIQLTLNPKLHDVEDPEWEAKGLFMETKRCVLYIIRVQSGKDLMDILVRPVTREDEMKWNQLLGEEFDAAGKTRGGYSDANMADITSMSYAELKRTALENIMRLETQFGRISRQNHYQDLLNAIALDIRTKSRRRIQRQREIEGVKLTLGNLHEKAVWLEQQRKSYDNYIEQAMMTLQNKKGCVSFFPLRTCRGV